MKAYCGNDGKIRLFRPNENFKRMNNSASRLCLPTFDMEEMRLCLNRFVEIEKDWVPQEEGYSLYLRPTMIGTEVRGDLVELYVNEEVIWPYILNNPALVSIIFVIILFFYKCSS